MAQTHFFGGLSLSSVSESLTVDVDVMRQKASTVEAKIKEMTAAFDALEATVNKTKGYWVGEAGDAHREYFASQKPGIEEIFQRLREHVTDLNQMADVYSAAEQDAVELSEDLPADVIE